MKPYACSNHAPFAAERQVQDGWTSQGTRKMVAIKDEMSKGCSYKGTALGKADKGCDGCSWRVSAPSKQDAAQ